MHNNRTDDPRYVVYIKIDNVASVVLDVLNRTVKKSGPRSIGLLKNTDGAQSGTSREERPSGGNLLKAARRDKTKNINVGSARRNDRQEYYILEIEIVVAGIL